MFYTYPVADVKKLPKITSKYLEYRGEKNGKPIYHKGIDIGVPSNSPLVAIYKGKVIRSNMDDVDGYGNLIMIEHRPLGNVVGDRGVFYTLYAHLTKRLVKVNDEVEKGDVIGLSGGNQGVENGAGNSTGAHLHFEIRKTPDPSTDDDWINPMGYLGTISFIDDKKEDIEDVIDDIKTKVNEIDIDEIKKSFKEKLKDPEFREKLAEKLNITQEELEERLEDDGYFKTMVTAGVDILKDSAPKIWKAATKAWGFVKDAWEGIKGSQTAGWFKDRFAKVEKKREAKMATGMWEQEEKIKKIIKKIL